MTIESPAASSAFKAKIRFDRSPPTTYYSSFWQDYVFHMASSLTYIKDAHALEFLPEENGLFGITLKPYQRLFDNFLWIKNFANDSNDNNVVVKKDQGGVVVNEYLNNSSNKKFLKFLGWRIIDPIYIESVGGDIIHSLALDEYTEQNSSSATVLTEVDRLKRQGAKWQYRKIIAEDGGRRLVPYQAQLQAPNNGPTGIGVHWGLLKYVNIPYRVGFYLDFYINKDIDLPAKSQNVDHMPRLKNPLETYFGTNQTTGWTNKDVFDGTVTNANNFFNFIGKSYIVVEINRKISDGDVFFLVIRSDKNPRVYQVKTGVSSNREPDNRVILIGEYKPVVQKSSGIPVGLAMLRGKKNNLKLMIRNFYGSIVIENNVFEEPWVVSVPIFEPQRASTLSEAPARTDSRRFHIATIGKILRVFGGNISCGVAYSPVYYAKKDTFKLPDADVFGANRNDFRTYFNTAGGNQMPHKMNTNNLFYANSAREIIRKKDNSVDSRVRIGSYNRNSMPFIRADVLVGGTGKEVANNLASIVSNDKLTSITLGAGATTANHTRLQTEITLKSGDVEVTHSESASGDNISWTMKNTLTPVLQYAYQRVHKRNYYPRRNSLNIEDIVTDFEITKQAEELHVIRVSGSMNINIHSPTVGAGARNRIIQSIGKARYLDITLENYCNNLNAPDPVHGQKLFTGIAMNPVVEERAGKRTVKFELKDFWAILEAKLMYNSPYFDGAIDSDVVEYLINYCGIRRNSIVGGSRDAMPISFSFAEPLAKFDDGRPVSDHIKALAKKYSKFAFFDAEGSFRYDPIPASIMPDSGSVAFAPSFRFYSSHYKAPPNMNINISPLAPQQVATAVDAATGQLNSDTQIAYDVKTTQWNMGDIVNKLLLQSIDARNRGYILVSDTNYDSLTNPDSIGYLGYEKTFVQSEAAFGSMDRVKKIARQYSRMYRPPYTINWKTRGGNTDVDVFDLVGVDDRMVIVYKISHKIDASKNVWDTEWQGEWIWHPLSSFNPPVN